MKKMGGLFWIFFIFFACLNAHAQAPQTLWSTPRGGTATFWVLHEEKGKFFLEEFRKSPGRLQEKTLTTIYADAQSAQNALNAKRGVRNAPSWVLLERDDSATELVDDKIWEIKNQWSDRWENKYKEWLEKNANASFFQKYKIATDCADVAFAFRWIFSRINYLPAANTLMGSEQIFTHESMRGSWKNIPTDPVWHKDRRFLTALNYVLDNTYTHSLMGDAYPIAINKNSLTGGAFFLNLYSSETGHTEFIPSMILEPSHPEPLRILASDVPRAVRELADYGFQGWGLTPTLNVDAFLKFRWPIKTSSWWALTKAEVMPNYSLEQFEPEFMRGYSDISEATIKHIMPNWNPNIQEALKAKVGLLLQKFASRVKIVQDGYDYCRKNKNCQEGSAGWENWSTPSRDHAIEEVIASSVDLYWDSRCDSSCRKELDSKLSQKIVTIEEKSLDLRTAMHVWENGEYSSNPNDSLLARWGLE